MVRRPRCFWFPERCSFQLRRGEEGILTVSVAQTQGRNIRHYANYLGERARAFDKTKTDWVRAPESRLEKISVEKGLLRETEVVQQQLSALLKCDVCSMSMSMSTFFLLETRINAGHRSWRTNRKTK